MSMDGFSPDYRTSRARFLQSARKAGASTDSLPLDVRGPSGEELAIDCAWIGHKQPKKILFHSSGLHGMEGMAGAAIQIRMLETLSPPPEGCAVVMVHALNPYGMAWMRRVNENNVDLNRNFLPEDDAFEGSSRGYKLLETLLNPRQPISRWDLYRLRVAWKVLRYGFNPLKQAVMQGQYEFDRGLFFGGRGLEKGPKMFLDWARSRLGSVRRAVAVDVHVGLGRFGDDVLLIPCAPKSGRFKAMTRSFGPNVSGLDPERSIAYRIRGAFHAALERSFPEARWYCVSQEFGTHPPLHMLRVLREENAWHHYGQENDLSHRSKAAMLDTFCPAHPEWRARVLARGLELAAQSQAMAFSEAGQRREDSMENCFRTVGESQSKRKA